jgi:Tfp pilus assembly protein PilN
MRVNPAIKKLTSFTSGSTTKLKDSILRPLWKILTFSPADDTISPEKNLSVSLEKGALSVAYGSRFLSRIKIKGVKKYSFEEGRYPQPEGLASSLASAINDLGAAGTNVSLSIPKTWAVIKIAEFPVTIKENLSDAVSYELDRLTPFSPEDAFYDFKILKESSEKLTILIIAAKSDLIKPYIDALREKGITVSRITVNLSGIGTLCRYIGKEKNFICMELNEDGYEGALFLDGIITGAFTGIFTRGEKIPLPPSLLKEDEGKLKGDEKTRVDMISADIKSIIETTKSQDRSPKIFVLLKDKSPALKELLKLRINMPLVILNETDIKFRSSGLLEDVPYAAIGGILESLWPKANGLNLFKKGHYHLPKTPFAFTIILILAITAMWILSIISPFHIEEKRLDEIDHQIMIRKDDIRKVEALKKEIDSLSNEISTINNFKVDRLMSLTILKELTAILPKTAWLTRVRITESTVDIEGYASSASTLLSKLEASKYFKKAEFASPTFRDARMNADRFNIKMEVEGFKKEEGESPKKNEKK